MESKKLLISVLCFIFMISCNSELNVGITGENTESATFKSEKSDEVSFTRDELLALYVSQKGSTVSTEEVRGKLIKSHDRTLNTESLSNSNSSEIKTLWIKDELKATSEPVGGKGIDSIPLYVFQDKKGEGFVVASGDVRLPGVFAYSSKGTFDTRETSTGLDVFNERLPLYIMDSLARFQARYDSLLASAYGKLKLLESKNVGLRSTPGPPVEPPNTDICVEILFEVQGRLLEEYGPLVQVEWGRDYPYNKFCPDLGCSDNQGHALVGCVAVACAQIMSYHQYPSVLGGISLDWNNMTAYPHIDNLSSTYQDQIAHLMYYTAEGVYMNFGCDFSGSNINNAYYYLQNIGYTSDIGCSYNLSAIKSSISNNRPLYIQGFQPSNIYSGHAWVIDGYKAVLLDEIIQIFLCDGESFISLEDDIIFGTIESYVHFNWGWSGSIHDGHNGFYLSSVMNYTPKSTDPYILTYNIKILPNIRH